MVPIRRSIAEANKPIEPDCSVAELATWHLDRYVRLTFRLARKLSAHRKFETARKLMERVITVTSDKPEDLARYLLFLGELDEELYHYEAAATTYRRAVMLEPIDRRVWYDAHYALGCSLLQMARYREGETVLREAIRIDPSQHIAYRELGGVLEDREEYAEAANMYAAAALLRPGDRSAMRCLRTLVQENDIVRLQFPEMDAELAKCRRAAKEKKVRRLGPGGIHRR
jgi:tetratricopeptide (TPR) repeat protein